ncbi:MAG: hypothetical protein AMJ53_16470, partial [Gammaproteobacteria bacterium SG8_11]
MGEKNKPRFGAANQWVPRIAIVLLLLVGSAGGYMWYWTKAPLPVEAQAAEAALADGHLVAIAHINVAKFIQLNRFMFGELDPEMLPMQTEDKDLINALFNGPANLREKSDQLLFAVHVPVPSRAVRTLLLSGRFDKDAVLRTLESYYLLKDSEGESWYVMQEKPTQTDATCPSKTPGTLSKQSWYLFLGPKLAMIVDDRNYGAQLLDRFEAGAPAAQDIGRWEQYRADQLASLMVMSIPGASKALSGMSGMAAQQAATEHQEVTGVAASLGLDLLARGLNANLSLISNDTTWKRNTTDEIRQQLLELKDDTRRVTPTLAKLLSQIQVSDRTEALEIDVVLDGSILENLSQVMQESFSSMFQVGISVGQQDGPLEEQLQREPKNYAANAAFASLPELELAPHDTKPLFKQDAFTIDLGSIRINESALVELQLQSKVALPKGESQFGGERTGEFSLAVDSVEDTMGNDLRRDERCVEPNEIFHRSPNHQPETTTSIFQEHAQITK